MKGYTKFLAIFALCMSATCGFAMTKAEVDATWERLVAERRLRVAGEEKAAVIRAGLDENIINGKLYNLWKMAVKEGGENSLEAAWSLLKTRVPEGDIKRWAEVNYFEIPSIMPRPFMVIDALYVALIELSKLDGGEWIAADLLKSFSFASHGRHTFISICPEPVAEALAVIVEKTKLNGIWTPTEVVGHLPIARSVHGSITHSGAISRGMQFLDGAGIPSGNGFYAWDRKTGRIYEVADDNSRIRIPK